MKKIRLYMVMMLSLLIMSCGGGNNSGNKTDNNGNQKTCNDDSKKAGEHEYVDLGLTSGTLWATTNIGGDSIGYEFAWGETDGKFYYTLHSYKWFNIADSIFAKYNPQVDNKTDLDLADDAAYVKWGPEWRIPTEAQFKELIEECSWEWTGEGYSVRSKKNNKTLFLPRTNHQEGHSGHGFNDEYGGGYYWSRTLCSEHPDSARFLYFYSIHPTRNNPSVKVEDIVLMRNGSRYHGLSIRAVRVP